MGSAMRLIERCSPVLFLMIWSSGTIFVKLGLEYASVSVFLTIRSVGATVALFVALTLITNTGEVWKKLYLTKSLLFQTVLTGLLLQAGYQSAFFLALYYNLSPGSLSIVLGTQPILTSLFAGEKLRLTGYLFLALGIFGLTISIIGAREIGSITSMGIIFGTISVIAISLGSAMQKKLKTDTVASAFYQSLSASLVFLIALPLTNIKLTITPEFILSATWMIVMVSTLGVLLMFYLLKYNSASNVGILFYVVPILTITLDYLIFDNGVTWTTVAGGLVVLGAVWGFRQTEIPEKQP
ncbi:DMT family transporter [Pseudomonas abietaniphila]|uniref:EamA-like transporter family protein n=1 Tax=Pseudomonas abietaniphila TaxID=89065 RepID=A0A1G8HPA8_9PSED|nr:DMT family transporter [Pseudomonas abietaniphila]SDI08412.1 EamA-like transporter family protein [Pseudomonas abietaniphila]